MHAPRWLIALVLGLFAAGSPGQAEAQAFKPRGQAAPIKAGGKRKPAKKAKSGRRPAKKSSRKTTARRARATPASRARTGSARAAEDAPSPTTTKRTTAPEDADDYVLIEDDPA